MKALLILDIFILFHGCLINLGEKYSNQINHQGFPCLVLLGFPVLMLHFCDVVAIYLKVSEHVLVYQSLLFLDALGKRILAILKVFWILCFNPNFFFFLDWLNERVDLVHSLIYLLPPNARITRLTYVLNRNAVNTTLICRIYKFRALFLQL